MKIYTFGAEDAPVLLLLPGTCCHWKSNFGAVIRSFYFYFLPANERDMFLCAGQCRELDKANFQPYKNPHLSGPSAKIIRPAVASVKEFRHFRRF